MANLRQFSLSYLFLELFWGGVASAFTAPVVRQDPGWEICGFAAVICWGAVVGGIFHAMRDGAIAAFVILGVGMVFVPLFAPLFY